MIIFFICVFSYDFLGSLHNLRAPHWTSAMFHQQMGPPRSDLPSFGPASLSSLKKWGHSKARLSSLLREWLAFCLFLCVAETGTVSGADLWSQDHSFSMLSTCRCKDLPDSP